jgi:glucosamine-6-phosphate deaminase
VPIRVIIARDYDQASEIAAAYAVEEIRNILAGHWTGILGLATGSSPLSFYQHLVRAAREGRIDSSRLSSYNLDEYIGLPGRTARERSRHPQSYESFMFRELFGLLDKKFREVHFPGALLIEKEKMEEELRTHPQDWTESGKSCGRAVLIRPDATSSYLRWIREAVLEAYAKKIERAGGIDLQVVGVGGRGHVGFHESGIPFENSRVLLVRLDDETIGHAVADGHFSSPEEVPRYAVSMGAELIYRARRVLLLAMGSRKAKSVALSLAENPTDDVPISYGRIYSDRGGDLLYVIDREAAADVLQRLDEIRARGVIVEDQ